MDISNYSTRTRPSANSSRPKAIPPHESDTPGSWVEAKINRLSRPDYYLAHTRMMVRLGVDPCAYPTQVLAERLSVTLPEVERLRATLEMPDCSMTGKEWTTLTRRLDRLQGEADAILTTLIRRLHVGPIYGHGSARSTWTLDPEQDPFKDE